MGCRRRLGGIVMPLRASKIEQEDGPLLLPVVTQVIKRLPQVRHSVRSPAGQQVDLPRETRPPRRIEEVQPPRILPSARQRLLSLPDLTNPVCSTTSACGDLGRHAMDP